MKQVRIPQDVLEPDHWTELKWGKYYRESIEERLNPWFLKMRGFRMLKIGNLSAEINSENCTIPHHVNVFLNRKEIKRNDFNRLCLPFDKTSVDVCLLAHTLSWCQDPYWLLREVDRVLVDNGWIILSNFNPISLIGFYKLATILFKNALHNSRLITITQLLDWLYLLNFDVLYKSCFHILPWKKEGINILNTHFSMFGGLQLVIARKRTFPMIFNQLKENRTIIQLRPDVVYINKYDTTSIQSN